MSLLPRKRGADLRIRRVSDGIVVSVVRTKSHSIANTPANVTGDDDDGYVTLLERAATFQVTLEIAGVTTDTRFIDDITGDTLINGYIFELLDAAGAVEYSKQFDFFITALTDSGGADGAMEFSATLMSAAPPVTVITDYVIYRGDATGDVIQHTAVFDFSEIVSPIAADYAQDFSPTIPSPERLRGIQYSRVDGMTAWLSGGDDGVNNQVIYQFTLSTARDFRTAVFDTSFDLGTTVICDGSEYIGAVLVDPTDSFFIVTSLDPNGGSGAFETKVASFELDTPGDITSLNAGSIKMKRMTANELPGTGGRFRMRGLGMRWSDGTKLYVKWDDDIFPTGIKIAEYTISARDVETIGVPDAVADISPSTEGQSGIYVNSRGKEILYGGTTLRKLHMEVWDLATRNPANDETITLTSSGNFGIDVFEIEGLA